jgi:hypothetical protein
VQSRIADEPAHPLTILLQKYDQRTPKTQAQMSRDCWLDETYISRLLRGERRHPSRDALNLLAVFGLGLPLHLTDELLMAADYKPLALASAIR